jgi:hypothetical protein
MSAPLGMRSPYFKNTKAGQMTLDKIEYGNLGGKL